MNDLDDRIERVPRRGPRWLAAAVMAVGLGLPFGSQPAQEPADPAAASARLAEVRSRIAEVTRRLDTDRMARDEAAAALREIERRLGELARDARSLDVEAGAHRDRLSALERARSARLSAIRLQREALVRHVRTAFAMGRQDRLKLLLNLEDVGSAERAVAYHGYVARARTRRIDALRGDLARLGEVEAEIRTQVARLGEVAARKAQALASLEASRRERGAILERVGERISDREGRLARLESDASKLEQLLEALERELSDIPPALGERAPFSSLRGRLPWPVPGALRTRYGALRDGSGIRWSGVTIGGQRGATVRAVSHGRVAYADWLRGFGLLLIIDHGEGYMTLYGSNEALYREVGDWVERGDTIATVGDSGGRAEAALYFEIRHDGAPVDPSRWCAGSPGNETGQRAIATIPAA